MNNPLSPISLRGFPTSKRIRVGLAALVVIGVFVAGFISVSGRAAARGVHLPASLTKISARRIARTAPAATRRPSSAPGVKPLAPFSDSVIAGWDFTGLNNVATATATTFNANLVSTSGGNTVTRGSGAAASAGADSFRTTGFQNNGISTANTDYFQITLRATSGFVASLSAIDARFAGTASFAVSPGVTSQFAYSLDGSTFTLIGSPSATIGTPATMTQINLTGISALQNVPSGTTITLRYYASGQTTTGGWGFNSPSSGTNGLAITGSTSASGSTTPPTLTAAAGATVDANFDITFTDDATWRGAVTSVKYGATTLTNGTDYTLAAGTLTLKPAGNVALQTAGTQTVTVTATGYIDATVSQTIGAGAPNKLAITTQPAAPASNGTTLATQPVVAIRDRYGNATTSTATVVADVGSGTWTIGGTTSKAGVSGTATFTNLTATSAAAVTGATIDFTSTGLTHIVSSTFNIPAPPTLYTWSASGTASWATASNWTPSGVPGNGDAVQFTGSSAVTVTNVPTVSLTSFAVTGTGAVTLQAAGSVTVSVGGGSSPQLNVAASASLVLDGSSAITILVTTGNTGAVSGSITVQAGVHVLKASDASGITFNSGGSFTTGTGFTGAPFGGSGDTSNSIVFNSGSTFTHNSGNNPFQKTQPASLVVFNLGSTYNFRLGGSQSPSASGRTYPNLVIQNSTNASGSGASNFQFQTLTVEAGSTFSFSGSGSNTVIVKGDIVTSGTSTVTVTSGTGGIQFNGGGTQSIGSGGGSGTISLDDIQIASGTTVNLVRSVSASFQVLVNGSLNSGTNVVTGAGSFTLASGGSLGIGDPNGITTTDTTSTGGNIRVGGTRSYNSGANYTYNGSAAQVTGNGFPSTANNLTVNNSAGASLSGASTAVNGTLTLTSGILAVGTNTLTLNNGVSATSGSLSSSATGTVNYNQGSAGQSVLAASYGNLTFSNQNKTLASSGTIGIAGTFTTGSAIGHTVAGSTIDFTGSGPQSIPAFTYNNLSNGGNGNRTLASSGTIGIAGTFSPGSGSYTITGSTIDFTGSGGQTIPAFNYNNLSSSGSGGRTLASSGTVGIKGTFSPGSAGYTVTSSTVDYNGSTPQTGPSVVFSYNNLTLSNSAGLTLAASQTVNGTLDLAGGDISTTASFTLFQGGPSSATGAFDVVGNVNRGDVAASTTKSFGNVNVQITQGPVIDGSDFTITLAKSAPNDFTNAVKRTYDISKNGGSLVPVGTSLRLRYKISPDELNGNAESSLELWRKDGSTYTALGGTVDTSNHHVTYAFGAGDHFSRWVVSDADAPTDVAMMNFKATRYDKQVLLEWQTGYEVSNIGFNVYREKNGNLERVTPEPVAGSALIAGPRVELKAGLAYSWVDEEEIADCGSRSADCENRRYWIEDIDLSGRTTIHGPFGMSEIAVGDQPGDGERTVLGRRRSPLLSSLGREASLAQTAEAATVPVEPTAKPVKVTAARMAIQSGVASQTAVKLSVQGAGWYRVEQADLMAAGLPSDANPAMLQLLAEGKEVPILITGGSGSTGGGSTGSGSIGGVIGGGIGGGAGVGGGKTTSWSGIEFYGIGIDSPSTVNHVYWLVVGSQQGLRITTSDAKGGPVAPSSFSYTIERRDKTVYFPALKNGGAEKWFGPLMFNAQAVDQSVNVQHVAPSVGALLLVSLQGFNNTAHTVRVLFNGVEVGTMRFTGLQKAAQKFVIQSGNLHEGVNQIQLIGPPGTSDLSMVEFVQLSYAHTNTADNNSLRMQATGQQQVTIDGFTNSAIRVMDVTDANSPVELKPTVNGAASKTSSAYSVTVVAPSSGARTLLAFASDQQKRPAAIVANQPSNYRDPSQRADYLVITRKDLIGSFGPLADLRKSQNLRPMLIDIDDIYDEFSFGNKTPQALKDFLSYAKTSWALAPRFVVLAGDATYDPKNYAGLGDFDLVPTRLMETAYNEAATDDWFGDVNGDGVPDMAIGRLPVRTPAEASAMVTKLVNYDSSVPSPNVLLVADRNSSFDFESADTQLKALIPASLTVTDIRRGQLGDTDARTQLLAALNQGAKVVNYYGHGSTTVWTDAPILRASDAAGLTNQTHLSLVVSMTCLNGYFHSPSIESLGESLLKSQGGAIAVWASSGLTDAQAQTVMSRDAINRLLSGSNLTIGEVVALAKGSVTNLDVRRTWILLGDPATRLR